MGIATMSTVDSILKEIYQGRITDQLQNETVALKRIERSSDGVTETVGGKYVDFPVRITRNAGIGARSENEALPTPYQQGYAAVHVPLKYIYGLVRLSGQVMSLADKNYQSFASAMDREMDGLKSDIQKDANRQVYGDGTGLMASVTADGANTVTVDNIQYLEVGQQIDIRTRSNGTSVAADRQITVITAGTGYTGTVTYSGADVAATANEGIYRMNNYASGTSREITGFGKIVAATGALHNIDPATTAAWAASVLSNSGTPRALSEGLMIQMCDVVRIKGGKVSAIFTNLGVRRSYFNLLTQQRRYTDTKSFAGGFQGLPFNYGTEIPVVEDIDCPPNRMFFLDESHLKVYQSKEWHWADEDGNVLKWVNGYDAFDAVLRKYWELATDKRNAHGLLSDITEG